MYATGISIRPLSSRHRAWLPGAWRLALLALLVVLASLALALTGMLIPAFAKVFVDSVLVFGATALVGPLLIGMITAVTASQKAGMAVLVVFFVAGLGLLMRVRD